MRSVPAVRDDQLQVEIQRVYESIFRVYGVRNVWRLNSRGERIAEFDWPGNKLRRHVAPLNILTVKDGKLYAYEETRDELGRKGKVLRYDIMLTKK